MGVIIFNGIASNSKRFSAPILVEQPPEYTFPSRDSELTHVAGRNGDIYVDNGSYNNVIRTYNLAIASETEDYTRLAYELSSWLHSASGYAVLSDSYDPNHYCMAVFNDEGTITNVVNHAGKISVGFNCKPQRYLITGDDQLPTIEYSEYAQGNVQGKIFNPTMFESRPIIKIYGTFDIGDNGSIAITLGNEDHSQAIYVKKCSGSVEIDSELMDCYRIEETSGGGHRVVNANQDVNFSDNHFPYIYPGTTNIVWYDSRITAVEVTPRWWEI